MKRIVSITFILGALALPAFSQDPGDEPDHGVARLSLLSGDVTVRRGDSGEDIAAEPNAPLVARDHVFTENGARAEIQLDWANMFRLAPNSEARMATLADRDFRVELAAGTMTFRVLRDSNAQVEISTPTAAVRPKRQGTYRITVRDDYSTEITVRSGESDIFAGQDYSPLRSGQTLIVQGDPANPVRNFVGYLPHDDWDSWNESRDRDLERSDSYKYVSRDVYGADDLYGYGRWVYDPPYGWVWAPNVAASWAPYRDGRWYYADYYGWTWVSGDPWGWAPYHYGRWYHAPRYGWVWYPGGIGPRQYWRPALVSFFGWGGNFGSINIGFGFGNVGWVPLAPYEVYRPWYGRNVTVVNVNNISVVNTYRNARFANGYSGVTSVVAGDFGRRHVSVNNYVRANDRDLGRAAEVRGRVPFEPTRDARKLSDRQVVSRNDGRRNNDSRQFVTSRPDNSRSGAGRAAQLSDRQSRQPGQDTRQAPRNEARTFVNSSASPGRTAQPSDRQSRQPGQDTRQAPRNEARTFVNSSGSPSGAAQPSDRQSRQPGQDTRQAPRNEARTFVNSSGSPGQTPSNRPVQPNRLASPDQPNRSDRSNTPERSRAPERAAASPPERTFVTGGGSSSRAESRIGAPETFRTPTPAPNRGFDRPAEVGRGPDRSQSSPSVGIAERPANRPAISESRSASPGRREQAAPAAQSRRSQPQSSQPAQSNSSRKSQGKGRR